MCKKDKVIKKSYLLRSNETGIIKLSVEDFNPNHYIVTKAKWSGRVTKIKMVTRRSEHPKHGN